jgi:hypothetical protein
MAQLVAAEGRQDMGAEVRSIAGERLGFEMRFGVEPLFGPFVDGDLREAWVGPVAADEVGLDGGHEPVGIRLACEASRAFPT